MAITKNADEIFGQESYEKLFRQVLLELGVTRLVEKFEILIDPKEPVFIISMRTGRARSAIKIKDVALIDQRTSGTFLTISDETYAPALLSRLWEKYGRDRIEQMTRYETLCRSCTSDEVGSLELDPGEELRKKLLDAVWRLLPEGFKVRQDMLSERAMTIVATEHIMQDKWLLLAKEMHKRMEAA